MFCTNCGSAVEGNFCSKCGSKIESKNLEQGNLVIERKSNVIGCAININISIDNGNIINLASGSKLVFNLKPGQHQISYKVWCRRKKEVSINIVDGKNYYLKFSYDILWGGFKISKDSVLN